MVKDFREGYNSAMKSEEVRKKYLSFFKKRGHEEILPSPLVLEDDPTTLFTSSGMQPLVPYLMGKDHSQGKRLVNIQPCIRLQDIEEVGDNRHTTYFEMLGNWSLGDYYKKDQIAWFLQFLVDEIGLLKDKLWVSVYGGGSLVPKDDESYAVWKSLGISEEHIVYYEGEQNWWSRSGSIETMPVGEIGGPDTEVFYEFDVSHDSKYGKKCHPNCDCGRFLEVGNSVFIQYKKDKDNKLTELPLKNVDFGGGLERIVAASMGNPDIFKSDIYTSLIKNIEDISQKKYEGNENAMRVIADHLRASHALIESGVVPSNKLQGYILRRLIRRMVIKFKDLKKDFVAEEFDKLTDNPIISEEYQRFQKTLDSGLAEISKLNKVSGKDAFNLYQTYGFPVELTKEILEKDGKSLDFKAFDKEMEKHRSLSRSKSSDIFKGGLADSSGETVKLHTVTHLLHASLRKVLGNNVSQKGSNITNERLRFDFSNPQKLTDEQLIMVEALINEQIRKNLPVASSEMSYNEAAESGALAFFRKRYGGKVRVYEIGDFSKEVCGGPHVKNTSELKHVRIIKQEKIGDGVIRVYAVFQDES